MAFNHNSKVADSEPKWGDVDKTKTPRLGYADRGEADKKSTWKFPHHWVKGGGGLDDKDVYTTGTMFLHAGGLNAAWAAAQGARTGKKASAKVIEHLSVHRKALGLDEGKDMSDVVIDKDARREIRVPEGKAELISQGKAGKPNDPGFVQGYAAVWDVVDLHREVVRRGAFAKSIQERVASRKVKLMGQHLCHGGSTFEVIGTVTEMKEDDFGLWFHAPFGKTNLAQDVRQNVVDDHVSNASIGFMPVKWSFINDEASGREIIEHTEMKALEVTLTAFPIQELAILTGAKSVTIVEYMKKIRERIDPTKLNVDALSKEGKSRVIEEVFGGRDGAAAFQSELATLGTQVVDLLSEESPQPSGKSRAQLHEEIEREIEEARLSVEALLLI